ncbi:MAG: hypothetical protein RLZ12_243 [Bacillota bacterium]
MPKIELYTQSAYNPKRVIITTALRDRLKLAVKPERLYFGLAEARIVAEVVEDERELLIITPKLAKKLGLVLIKNIKVDFLPRQAALYLGPMLGIMVSRINQYAEEPFGVINEFVEECDLVAKKRGIKLVVFTPEHVDLQRARLGAWHSTEQGWFYNETTLPQVIYNRLSSRKYEEQKNVQRILAGLTKRYNIPVFNVGFLNKLEVFEAFSSSNFTRKLLPETARLTKKVLYQYLADYDVLYLKPSRGSLGRGIMKVTCEAGGWFLKWLVNDTVKNKFFTSRKLLALFITRKTKKNCYLVQQGIDLAAIEGQAFDFRILVQRRPDFTWQVTTLVARVSKKGCVVSNVARGATVLSAKEALQQAELLSRCSTQDLKQTSLKIMQVFDKVMAGHFAEIGIDLAVDKKGKIWLLELNAKPSKLPKKNTPNFYKNPGPRASVYPLMDYVEQCAHF